MANLENPNFHSTIHRQTRIIGTTEDSRHDRFISLPAPASNVGPQAEIPNRTTISNVNDCQFPLSSLARAPVLKTQVRGSVSYDIYLPTYLRDRISAVLRYRIHVPMYDTD